MEENIVPYCQKRLPHYIFRRYFHGNPLVGLFLCPAAFQRGHWYVVHVYLSYYNGLIGAIDFKNALSMKSFSPRIFGIGGNLFVGTRL